MNKTNYQLLLDKTIDKIKNEKREKPPRLLIHACCAPCSSYVIEYLSEYFDVTLYFYNPNITPYEEFAFRAEELKRLLEEMPTNSKISLFVEKYNSDEFYNYVKGMENYPEGGPRCKVCYEQRLRKTAEFALKEGFEYFTTTLSISPYKNSHWLNEIGGRLAEEYGVDYLFSDFKKKNGYKRSIELSKEYSLYRQDYCGCEFSKKQKTT